MGLLQNLEGVLSGKKTYLVSAGAILTAIVGFLSGSLDLAGTVTAILAALGLASLRSGISKGPSA